MASRLQRFEQALDRAIGIFLPSIEARRIQDRMQSTALRQYAAAKQSRTGGGWAPLNTDINTLIRTSNPQVRAKVRELVRDFPYFARAVRVLVDFTVGTGIQFQSRVTVDAVERGTARRSAGYIPEADRRKLKLHTKYIAQIEYAYRRWMDEADASGRLHYFELERLWRRQDVENGEGLLVMVWDKRPGRYLPLSLQMYEPDWLTSDFSVPQGNNLVDQGIEFDRMTGQVVAYHFAVPEGFNTQSGSSRTTRIAAEHVIHGFETLRPGQLRGISPFTSGVLLADDLQDFLDSNLDRARMASKWLAFVETADVKRWQAGRTTTDPNTGHKLTVMDNAIIDFLSPGDKVNVNTADLPGESFDPYTKFILQMVSVATNTPFELLTNSYGGLNYNTLRTLRNDWAKICAPTISRHIRQFSQPVFNAFLDAANLSGRLSLPGYLHDPYPWRQGMWQPTGQQPMDLLREGKGHIDLIKSNLESPQEYIQSRGRDPEDVLNELEEFDRQLKERGLTMGDVSTALQTNPAAIAGGKKK